VLDSESSEGVGLRSCWGCDWSSRNKLLPGSFVLVERNHRLVVELNFPRPSVQPVGKTRQGWGFAALQGPYAYSKNTKKIKQKRWK
jgi:hypothetical protein